MKEPEAINEQPALDEGKVVYSAPEEALSSSALKAAPAVAAQAAGQAGAMPKPAPSRPQTYEKDHDDPYADVGRNDPCPCGSGLKYKKCHGKDA